MTQLEKSVLCAGFALMTEEELYAVNGGAGKVHAIFDGSVDKNGKFSGGKFSVGFEFEF